MNKKLLIGLVIMSVVALGFSVFNFVRPPILIQTQDGTQPIEDQPTEVGAMPGNILQGSEFTVNGVKHFYAGSGVRIATTTICALKGPNATSTLLLGSIILTTSSSSAMTFTIAKAATAYATTTSLGTWEAAASSSGSAVSKRTAAGGEDVDETFAPNQYFVVGMQGNGLATGNLTGTAPVGRCQAEWSVLK